MNRRADLLAVMEKQKRKIKVESLIKDVSQELEVHNSTLLDLEKSLKKEERDVEKLENISFSKMLYSLLGSFDEKLEKEEQEAIRAKANYTIKKQEVIELDYQLQKLKEEQKEYQGIDEEVDSLKQSLVQSMLPYNQTLSSLDQQYVNAINQLKEIEEALHIAGICQRQADKVKKLLSSASDWSTFDIIAGGVLSDIMKYDKLDSAQEEMKYLQSKLTLLKRELADVDLSLTMQEVTISFTRQLFDVAFDNIFSDISVSCSIDRARGDIDALVSKISDTISLLEANKQEEQAKIEQLSKQIETVILQER